MINPDTGAWEYSFPADRLADFNHIIDKANRRLERAGATARFEPTVTVSDRTETTITGLSVTVSYAFVTMASLQLAVGDYVFVARLVPEEAGMTVHTAPGESLAGWVRPAADDTHCDHCQVKRDRVNLFVVRNAVTGELIQLGQQCIALYLGLEPKGLWALDFQGEIDAAVGGFGDGGGGRGDYSADIAQVLGVALAVTNGGKGYVSRANAEAWEKESTGSLVKRVLFGIYPNGNKPGEREERERILAFAAEGKTLAADQDLIGAVKAAADNLRAGDYADNLAVILAAPSGIVGNRNISTLASLVSAYYRQTEERVQATKAGAAQGFIGTVGERVRNFHVTATAVREFEGDYGVTTLLVGTTDDGHVVKWFASGSRDWDAGDRIHFAAATVKAHENYKGTDQTALTRGHKVEVVES
jgi:hypothetical protein